MEKLALANCMGGMLESNSPNLFLCCKIIFFLKALLTCYFDTCPHRDHPCTLFALKMVESNNSNSTILLLHLYGGQAATSCIFSPFFGKLKCIDGLGT